MLIKKPADLPLLRDHPEVRLSEPAQVPGGRPGGISGRRELLSPSAGRGTKLPNLGKSPFSTTKSRTPSKTSPLQQFLRVRHRQGPAGAVRQELQDRRPGRSPSRASAPSRKSSRLDEIMKLAPLEERIYRHRCVEAWSIVVPWIGIRSARCSSRWSPRPRPSTWLSRAITIPSRCRANREPASQFPYVEGLRLDEAMHPLALLSRGHVRRDAAAPERRADPPGSPVEVRLQEHQVDRQDQAGGKQPPTTWNISNPHEYGFYSNVNPQVDHPRWSQATERRLGEFAQAPHPDVQRLRRPGGQPVQRHGPARRTTEAMLQQSRWTKVAGVRCCAWRPLFWLAWRAWNHDLPPIRSSTSRTSRATGRSASSSSRWPITPAAQAAAAAGSDPLPAHDRAVRVLLRHACTSSPGSARQVLRLAGDREGYRQAAVHHGGLHGLRADDPAGRHFHHRLDPAPGRQALAAAAPAGLLSAASPA